MPTKKTRLSKGGISVRRKRLAEVLSGRDVLSQFHRWQKEHPNFMTPHVISISGAGKRLVEFSEGTGFDNKPLYGVTVVENIGKDQFKILHDLKVMDEPVNQSFFSRIEAEKHIARVEKHLGLRK